MNAKARYQQFAAKADEEGYGPVASLFRAAAMAEGIHADNHRKVIVKLGASPFVKFEIPDVKSRVRTWKRRPRRKFMSATRCTRPSSSRRALTLCQPRTHVFNWPCRSKPSTPGSTPRH